MCQFLKEDGENYELQPADTLLIEQVNSISLQHLICFLLISIAEFMNNTDLDAHFSVYLNIVSCLLYQ